MMHAKDNFLVCVLRKCNQLKIILVPNLFFYIPCAWYNFISNIYLVISQLKKKEIRKKHKNSRKTNV